MKRSRLFTGSIVTLVMLVLALAGGVASAAPVASAPACVAGRRAPSHLSATASQRYVAFKQAQIERMSEGGDVAKAGCVTSTQVASFTILRPSAYAAFKDRQAGN
jgi:hypothetical protein